MKRKKYIIIIAILLVVELGVSFLMYKSAMNKDMELSDVKLLSKLDKEMFAIMVSNGDGTYSEQNDFPSDRYELNTTKSGCIDNEGKTIPNALSYVDNKAVVETGSTSFCYLYFDKGIPEVTVDNATINAKVLVNSLHISNADLSVEKLKNFYGDESGNYAENKSKGYTNLVNLSLTSNSGEEDNNIYTCNTTLNVTLDTTSQNNMGSALQKGDAVLHIFVNGHNTDYDLSDIREEGGSKSINIDIETLGSNTKNIRGYVELRNKEGDSQTYLANKNLQVYISADELSCSKTGKAVEADDTKVKDFIQNGGDGGIIFVNSPHEGGTDLSKAGDGSIKGWTDNSINYIGSDNKIFIRNMKSLFSSYISLSFNGTSKIDMTNLIFDRTTDMSSMFSGNWDKITELKFSENIDTSNVTNMSGMFYDACSLTIDLSFLDTSNVTNMNTMFSEANEMTFNVSNFDTSRVTDMEGMFVQSFPTSLDVSNFDTTNVTNMAAMFAATRLKYLDLRTFDFSKAAANFDSYGNNRLDGMFDMSEGIEIIVKDETQKSYIQEQVNSLNGTIKIAGEV